MEYGWRYKNSSSGETALLIQSFVYPHSHHGHRSDLLLDVNDLIMMRTALRSQPRTVATNIDLPPREARMIPSVLGC